MTTDALPPCAEIRQAVSELRTRFSGQLLERGDGSYDSARKVWNGSIDRYPAIIARCVSVTDVAHAIGIAKGAGLVLAVRGGGHNVAGFGTCQDGMVVDLSLMQGVQVDQQSRTARVQGGATWGVFDRKTNRFGLATPGGQVSTTGIGGLTLGGGIGWLTRKHGLSCDNLISVQVITADGDVVTANPGENEDLFWGVRGGGGNFGVVTAFEYRLHPVNKVLAGLVLHPLSRARRVLQFFRDYAAEAPNEVSLFATFRTPPVGGSFTEIDSAAPVLGIGVCYAASPDVGEKVIRPLRTFGAPTADQIRTMAYPALQSMFDEGAQPGLQNYAKAEYVRALNDDLIEAIVDSASRMSSPLSQIYISPLGGAVCRVGEHESAFSHRAAPYIINVLPAWWDPHKSQSHIEWARRLWATLRSFSTGGAYVNFLGNEGQSRTRAAYGESKYRTLVRLKNKYDPTNVFRLNQNIRPTT
jgi:FAD/FMN-containing dehydrogenase